MTTDIGTVEQFFADVDALSATLQLDFGVTPGDRPAAGYVERLAGKPAAAVWAELRDTQQSHVSRQHWRVGHGHVET